MCVACVHMCVCCVCVRMLYDMLQLMYIKNRCKLKNLANYPTCYVHINSCTCSRLTKIHSLYYRYVRKYSIYHLSQIFFTIHSFFPLTKLILSYCTYICTVVNVISVPYDVMYAICIQRNLSIKDTLGP